MPSWWSARRLARSGRDRSCPYTSPSTPRTCRLDLSRVEVARLDPKRGESLVRRGEGGRVRRQRAGEGPEDELPSARDEGAAGQRRDLVAEAGAGRNELRRRELEWEPGGDEPRVASPVFEEPDRDVVPTHGDRSARICGAREVEARHLHNPGEDPAVPAGGKGQIDPVAGEVLASARRCRRLGLVRPERECRKDSVHLGDGGGRRRLVRTRGDGDAVHVTGGGDVAARDRDEAAAAAGTRRRRPEVGALKRDRDGRAALARPEVADIHVHLPAAADRLPRDLPFIVVVRRKREARRVQNRSSPGADQDPGGPAGGKFEPESEPGDFVLRLASWLAVGGETAAAYESEQRNHEERSLHITSYEQHRQRGPRLCLVGNHKRANSQVIRSATR